MAAESSIGAPLSAGVGFEWPCRVSVGRGLVISTGRADSNRVGRNLAGEDVALFEEDAKALKSGVPAMLGVATSVAL